MSEEKKRLQAPYADLVRVREVTDVELPPVPARGPIEAWHEAYKQDKRRAGDPPPGIGAGHYQRIVLDLSTGEVSFQCEDWREERPYRADGPQLFPPYDWELVPEQMYWVIDSGVADLPYLTAEQGNALARRVAPLAQVLLDNLVEVPGTGELDWSPQSVEAGWDVEQAVDRDPSRPDGRRGVVLSMAQVVEADPELVAPRWADWTDQQLDQEAPYQTRTLGLPPDCDNIAKAMGLDLGERQRLTVVGTRAWMYGYRKEMATGRTPMDAGRWWAHSGRESLVSADSNERDLVHLAAREQRAATDEGVLLIGMLEFLRGERVRLRARLVKEMEQVLGPRRVDTLREASLAQAAVAARLDQILAWDDVAHNNYAVLGAAAGMTRQAVAAKAKKMRGESSDEEPTPVRQYVITCPHCGSTDVEEYGEPIFNTDDTADCVRCLTCQQDWALDPGADGSCTVCGGSGTPGAGPAGRKVEGQWVAATKCECVES